MTQLRIKRAVARTAIVFLGSCTAVISTVNAQTVNDICTGLDVWETFIEAEPANEYFNNLNDPANSGTRNEFLKLLGVLDIENPSLTGLLAGITGPSAGDDIPDSLNGIAGFSTVMALKTLLANDPGFENVEEETIVSGKIRDYIFLENKLSGHMSVDVCTQVKDRKGGQEFFRYYHWDIEFSYKESGEVKVYKRFSTPGDVTDIRKPFIGLDMKLPEKATDPNNADSIWNRNLNHKLHAQGLAVKVNAVYFRDPDSALTLIDPGLPGNRHIFYRESVHNCVDLFTEGAPPATIGELLKKDYCLGRCTIPAIVNTSGG